jgi:geranylgeranyl pyrophosphate synthase
MITAKAQEIDALTGQVTVRDYTDEELAEVKKAIDEEEIIKATKAKAQAKREAALAKLQALGLDTDDLEALGL